MRYSSIRKMDVSNGQGIGISLFVQGCHFHCRGCFNPETWDFNGGKEWTKEVEDKFLALANYEYIQRISILGGEPLCDENIETVSALVNKIRVLYPNKKVWVYTGYTWENLVVLQKHEFIKDIDVLVDGNFQLDKQDIYNEHIVFAGSTNQRIIDVKKTAQMGKLVLYKQAELTGSVRWA